MTLRFCIVIEFIVLLLSISQNISSTSEKTVFLIELSRHGSRKPKKPLPTFNIDLTRESLSDLTITGMRNHFNLGQLIRKKFQTIFSQKLDRNGIRVYTSSDNRTVNSAMSQVAGLNYNFEPDILTENPEQEHMWTPPNLSFDPQFANDAALPPGMSYLPLDVQDYQNNYMFAAPYLCSTVNEKNTKIQNQLKDTYKDLFQPTYKLFENKGYDPKVLFPNKKWNLSNVMNLSDMISSQIYDNPEFGVDYEVLLHTQFINSFKEYLKGSDNDLNRTINNKLIVSWRNWLHKFNSLDVDDRGHFPKMIFYSGHNSNIASLTVLFVNDAILNCMIQNYNQIISASSIGSKEEYSSVLEQLNQTHCSGLIPFASNVVIEVFEKNTVGKIARYGFLTEPDSLFVRFWFNNRVFEVDGKKEFKIKELIKYLDSLRDASYVENCGAADLQNKNPQKTLKVLSFCSITFAGLSVISVLLLLIIRKFTDKKYNEIDSLNEELINV